MLDNRKQYLTRFVISQGFRELKIQKQLLRGSHEVMVKMLAGLKAVLELKDLLPLGAESVVAVGWRPQFHGVNGVSHNMAAGFPQTHWSFCQILLAAGQPCVWGREPLVNPSRITEGHLGYDTPCLQLGK